MKNHNFLKNVSYSVLANSISFFVSVLLVLVVPKFLTPDVYGMWQLFLFYSSYAGFFHFGWIDGIYLRYAGEKFEQLDNKLFAGQFYGIIVLEIFVGVVIFVIANVFVIDPLKRYVLKCVSIFPLFYNFNLLCNFIFQITNCIKKYAKLVILERAILSLGVLLLFLLHINSFICIYAVKMLSLLGVTIFCVIYCKHLLVPNFGTVKSFVNETWENISVGLKLTIANTASVLIIGTVRYGISVGWDIITFGRISLIFNISNFLLVFINSMSIVLFPMLKCIETEKIPVFYEKIRKILDMMLFSMLLSYYPLRVILGYWLPQYYDSMLYFVIFFPVCTFESKVVLLINTYLKSLRQEVALLKINLLAVLASIILTFIMVCVFHNLTYTLFTIVVLCGFRCFLAEKYLEKILDLHLGKEMFWDCILVFSFIISGWYFNNVLCMVFYGCVLAIYIIRNRKEFISAVQYFRQ